VWSDLGLREFAGELLNFGLFFSKRMKGPGHFVYLL
jgi:hypothetical protein